MRSRLLELSTSPDAVRRLWWKAALGAVVLWAVYLLMPGEDGVLRNLVLYPGADLAAAAAVVLGVRLYRPRTPAAWCLIAAGLASFAVADFIYGIHRVTGQDPFPSSADVFYLAAYPLFIAGLQVAVRSRAAGEWGNLVDAAIITVTAALFALLLIADQYVGDPDISLRATFVASAYPLADVLLLAVAVTFLLGASWRPPALKLLAASIALTLAGDVVYSAEELFTSGGEARAADALLLAGTLAMGLAGLHPSMIELTAEPHEVTSPILSVPRVVGFYLVSLVPAVVLCFQALSAQVQYVWITIVALGAVGVLIVIRSIDLVRQTRRAGDREASLARLGSELLDSSLDQDEALAAAERAASDVLPIGVGRVLGADEDPGEGGRVFRAPVEVHGRLVAVIVADERAVAVRGVRDALRTVAHVLALALEHHDLLMAQQAAADRLAEQNAQLRELDRMKDQLVGSVSHELRTPLTSIGGYTEMLIGEEFGALNGDQMSFATTIERNCRRLNRLIDDILFVSRVDAGRLSLERSWVDINEVAGASVIAALPRAAQGQVTLDLAVDEGLPELWSDPTRLTQMFDNLISNAVKFTPPNGTIWVRLGSTGDVVHVEVEDTGMGIPPEEIDRLFERFFRTSTVGEVAGTGLGLSIVKSIVEVHDGTISVSSTEGVGTTFRVELPARPRSEVEQSEPRMAR